MMVVERNGSVGTPLTDSFFDSFASRRQFWSTVYQEIIRHFV
jgi:hypothetical protein